jgi:hypothetical protein
MSISDRTLVHQLIRGHNAKYNVLKIWLPLLPKFSSVIEASELFLNEESAWEAKSKCVAETTLLATGSAQ